MNGTSLFVRSLLRDRQGSMALETALITPLLAAMALGTFDVAMMVSREQQLQSASNEASEIILAAAGGTGVSLQSLDTILETSLGLANKITVAAAYRCGTTSTTSSTVPTCASGEQMYTYVKVTVADTYTPLWTKFGVGNAINFNVQRTVQVS